MKHYLYGGALDGKEVTTDGCIPAVNVAVPLTLSLDASPAVVEVPSMDIQQWRHQIFRADDGETRHFYVMPGLFERLSQ